MSNLNVKSEARNPKYEIPTLSRILDGKAIGTIFKIQNFKLKNGFYILKI